MLNLYAAAGGVSSIVMIIIMVGIFYFMFIRPQNKEEKRKSDMRNALEIGDTILTSSGFYGTIIDLSDETTVIVEFGNNRNCRIPMQKAAIVAVEKPEDATEDAKED